MSSYTIYQPLLDRTRKYLYKGGYLDKKSKKLSDPKVIGSTLIAYSPDMVRTMDFMIMSEDWYWRKHRHSLFLPDKETVDRLLLSNFDGVVDYSHYIQPPFKSFTLSLPSDYKIAGYPAPGALITWSTLDGFGRDVIHPFCDEAGISRPQINTDPENIGVNALHITYPDPEPDAHSKMAYCRIVVSSENFGLLLKSETTQQFLDNLGSFNPDKMFKVLASEPYNAEIQFFYLRLALAICVFNQSTHNQFLFEGLPGKGKINIQNLSRTMKPAHSTLSMPDIERQTLSKNPHYRRGHFRQLRSDRFYKNEYKDIPRGSRWVYVNDTYVDPDNEVDPYTQKVN